MLILAGWAHAAWACGDVAVERGRVPRVEHGLTFQTAKLRPESEVAVKQLICLMTRDPLLLVRVEVHTDAQGADTYNLSMSQQRADAVRAALVEGGVGAERVTAVGYGESQGGERRVEVYAGSSPDRGRPPVPVAPPPAPVPVPAPVASVDWCARVSSLGDAVPRWAGARCAADGIAWSCEVSVRPEVLVGELSGCVRVVSDGSVWYANTSEGTLMILASPGGASLRWR